ncbi:MAG: hypothetical protein GX675_04880 [Erysipelotrichaceae bacterium]|nr:hypothetical protein [Erysipelotrichaceae bacterium]
MSTNKEELIKRQETLNKAALKAYSLFKKEGLTFQELRYVLARIREVASTNAKI